MVVTGKPAGITTLDELLQAAHARPGELSFTTTGIGTGTHVGIQELNLAVGINATHVPPGSNDAITDVGAKVVHGETDYTMSPISIVEPRVRDGELIPLGVTTTTRSPLLPEVPTIDKAGAPSHEVPIWYGLWAPTGTPPAIIKQLSADISTSVAAPNLTRQLEREGAQPISMTQQQFARFVLDESQRAAQILKRASIARL